MLLVGLPGSDTPSLSDMLGLRPLWLLLPLCWNCTFLRGLAIALAVRKAAAIFSRVHFHHIGTQFTPSQATARYAWGAGSTLVIIRSGPWQCAVLRDFAAERRRMQGDSKLDSQGLLSFA